MKHILLTNDDGYQAEGLQALYQALRKEYRVTVVAPMGQRSAASHSVSFHKSFSVERTQQGFAVSGTPADCVKWALQEPEILGEKVDLVASGINQGANMGIDVHYSGTVSACMEAMFYGVAAVAFSCHGKQFADSAYLGELSLGIVRALEAHPLPPRRVLNVNFPNLVRGDVLEYVAAPLGFQQNNEELNRQSETEFFYNGYYGVQLPQTGSDVDNLFKGRICLTPLSWDMTDRGSMHLMQSIIRQQ